MRSGFFVVLEGIDRTGKSTQAERLEHVFGVERGIPVKRISFPDREGPTGRLIDACLRKQAKLPPRALHLLFSANRYEKEAEIREALQGGAMVICDRYTFSGVAYSVGVHDLPFEWCLLTDQSLPEPDLVLQIEGAPSKCKDREAYGEELYEKLELQHKVEGVYRRFHSLPTWRVVAHGMSIADMTARMVEEIDKIHRNQAATS